MSAGEDPIGMAAAGEEAETEVIPSDAGWDAAASDPWVFGSCCIGAAFEGLNWN